MTICPRTFRKLMISAAALGLAASCFVAPLFHPLPEVPGRVSSRLIEGSSPPAGVGSSQPMYLGSDGILLSEPEAEKSGEPLLDKALFEIKPTVRLDEGPTVVSEAVGRETLAYAVGFGSDAGTGHGWLSPSSAGGARALMEFAAGGAGGGSVGSFGGAPSSSSRVGSGGGREGELAMMASDRFPLRDPPTDKSEKPDAGTEQTPPAPPGTPGAPTPTVPEPSSALVVGAGVMLMARRRRR